MKTIPSIDPHRTTSQRELDHMCRYEFNQFYTKLTERNPEIMRQAAIAALLRQEMFTLGKPDFLVANASMAVIQHQDHAATLRFITACRIERLEKGVEL